jgi:trigger factor
VSDNDWEISVDREESGEVSFEVSVPEEDVESERKQAINELKQEVEISGFRKGKVPDSIIEKQRPQQVQQALLQRLVPRICREVYEEHDIEPIQNPSIEEFNFDDGFFLKAVVLERPTVDVSDGNYLDLDLEIEDESLSEADVDERIDELRSAQASLEPIPIARPVEEGDFVDIDFQAYDDQGDPVEGTAGENQVIEIGSERFLPEVEEGLIGASEGDQRRIEASFPDDFVDDNLAGSSLNFQVTVNEIKEERKPEEASEEFLEEMDVESIDELRDRIEEQMSEADEQNRRQQLSDEIYDALLDQYEFSVPESLVEDEIDSIIDDYRQQVESQDREFEAFLDQQDKDLEELREETRPEAEQRIKLTLIFQAIAEEEEVEVTEEEFREHLEELSEQTGMDVEELEDLPDEQQQSLRYQLRDDKVLDRLIESANIEEVEPDESDSEESEHITVPGS